VIEDVLPGVEVSYIGFCDGERFIACESATDYKRVFDADEGPNTGGMGAVSPSPYFTAELKKKIDETVVIPVLKGMKSQQLDFRGILYIGLMVSPEGDPFVLEFNTRFGDPETQSYMRLLETDLLDIFEACIDGTLKDLRIQWSKQSACCIVIASKGYPATSQKGIEIQGIDTAQKDKDIVVFHAGTKKVDDTVLTNGGRVLGVTAIGKNLNDSLKKAYAAVEKIKFNGMQYRRDIGKRKPPVFKKF
jgi:phosphoribosylamine--glycine ligase